MHHHHHKYLHDLQQGLGDGLQGGQRERLSLVGARREGAVPVAGAEGDDGGRLHLADAEQQVELWQGELGEAQPQDLLGLLCKPSTNATFSLHTRTGRTAHTRHDPAPTPPLTAEVELRAGAQRVDDVDDQAVGGGPEGQRPGGHQQGDHVEQVGQVRRNVQGVVEGQH